MDKYLILFSISPVQGFISQARKVKDLKAGSMILSELISNTIEKAKVINPTLEIIYPSARIISKPNQFLGEISLANAEKAKEFGIELEKFVIINFKEMAKRTFIRKARGETYPVLFWSQIDNFLEVYWIIKPLGDNYRYSYEEISSDFGSIKRVKKFDQEGEQGRKCNICGERNSLFYSSGKTVIRNGKKPFGISEDAISLSDLEIHKTLCAVCFTKRYYNELERFDSTAEIALMSSYPYVIDKMKEDNCEKIDNLEKIKSKKPSLFYMEEIEEEDCEELLSERLLSWEIKKSCREFRKTAKKLKKKISPYYAMLIFDGDEMGKCLSGENLLEKDKLKTFQKEISSKLGDYSKEASRFLNSENRGMAIYAGGDDFLGFMNLEKFLETAGILRKKYKRMVNDPLQEAFKLEKEITFSAGIVIAHYKTPLRIVLQKTREMEKRAKKEAGRNALAISVMKHSGELLETQMKWENKNRSNLEDIYSIIKLISEKKFSTSFITAIQSEFSKIAMHDTGIDKMLLDELKRLLKRSCTLKVEERKLLMPEIEQYLMRMVESANYHSLLFFNNLNIIRFLIKQLSCEGEKNEN